MKNYSLVDSQLHTYNQFISECGSRLYEGPTHSHHIIPKFMGGLDTTENRIRLSYEDHCKAHLILAECFPKDSKEYKGNVSAAIYCNHWAEGKVKIGSSGENNPFYGKKHSEEFKRMRSNQRMGIGNPNYGNHTPFSEDHKRKLREAAKSRDNSNIGRYDKSGSSNPKATRVRCTGTGKVFECMKYACEFEGITMDKFRWSFLRKGKYEVVR